MIFYFGRDRDDTIFGNNRSNIIFANGGKDIIRAGAGNDIVFAGRGNDSILGGDGNDILFGGKGKDRFEFNPNNVGEGHDIIADFKVGEDKIVLRAEDVVRSTPGFESVSSLDQSDLWGLSANKQGNVVITHPNGQITLNGIQLETLVEAGLDSFSALVEAGVVLVENGTFSESAASGSFNIISGSSYSEFIHGTDQNDLIYALNGNDHVFAGNGDDKVFGGKGSDTISGNKGDDILLGQEGRDTLHGNHGNDILEGGTGNDFLYGGTGIDTFVFDPSRLHEGHDTIGDFKIGEDKIQLKLADILDGLPGIENADGIAGFSAADLDASDIWNLKANSQGDVVVEHSTGSITLNGIAFDSSLSFAGLVSAGVVEVL